MFPIIYLMAQLDVINAYVNRYQLNIDAIYLWLAHYGELVKPHEESSLRTGNQYGYPINPFPTTEGVHIYRTHLGFRNAFLFVENNLIKITGKIGEPWHYNGYKKWVQE